METKKTTSKADAKEIVAGLSDYQKAFILTVAMIEEYGAEFVKNKFFPEAAGKEQHELALTV